jgi:hypothetical protein
MFMSNAENYTTALFVLKQRLNTDAPESRSKTSEKRPDATVEDCCAAVALMVGRLFRLARKGGSPVGEKSCLD